jgi:hypothetical protein
MPPTTNATIAATSTANKLIPTMQCSSPEIAEIRPELPYRAVQAGDAAVRARLHHAALYRRPRELVELAAFKSFGPRILSQASTVPPLYQALKWVWRHGHGAS